MMRFMNVANFVETRRKASRRTSWLPAAKQVVVAVISLLFIASVDGAPLYSIQPLETLARQVDVFAKGLNNRGQIVGYTLDADNRSHAVLWDAEGAHPLPPLSKDFPSTQAYRINDAGQIVGKSAVNANHTHAAYWDKSGVQDIGTLRGGSNSFAQDINAAGVVVGSSEAKVGSHAFTWTQQDGFVDYSNLHPESNLGVAGFNGINNTGLLVGTSFILLSPYQAVMARVGEKGPTNISGPGRFSDAMAHAVNDAGTIVGYQNPGEGSGEAAIFYGDGTYRGLGRLGLDESSALDINESGEIVGYALGFAENGGVTQKAFVYTDGMMIELLRHLQNSEGWDGLLAANGINDHGQIVGEGIYRGEVRGFIATPVPEPHGAICYTIAVIATHLLRRKEA